MLKPAEVPVTDPDQISFCVGMKIFACQESGFELFIERVKPESCFLSFEGP